MTPPRPETHGTLIAAVRAWCAQHNATWLGVGRSARYGWSAEVRLACGRVLDVQGESHADVLAALNERGE